MVLQPVGCCQTILENIGKFTETLHKIHTFVEAQRLATKSKIPPSGRVEHVVQDCQSGLKQGLDFFQIGGANIMTDLSKMRHRRQNREPGSAEDDWRDCSDTTSSDGLSMVKK
ncbi:hypothetical protein B0H14DRAFT_3167785, partial [Mycena olivaceomarginata]